jgi:hypothetical protein
MRALGLAASCRQRNSFEAPTLSFRSSANPLTSVGEHFGASLSPTGQAPFFFREVGKRASYRLALLADLFALLNVLLEGLA